MHIPGVHVYTGMSSGTDYCVYQRYVCLLDAGVYRAVCWFKGSVVTGDLVSSEIYIVLGLCTTRRQILLHVTIVIDPALTRRFATADGSPYFRLQQRHYVIVYRIGDPPITNTVEFSSIYAS